MITHPNDKPHWGFWSRLLLVSLSAAAVLLLITGGYQGGYYNGYHQAQADADTELERTNLPAHRAALTRKLTVARVMLDEAASDLAAFDHTNAPKSQFAP